MIKGDGLNDYLLIYKVYIMDKDVSKSIKYALSFIVVAMIVGGLAGYMDSRGSKSANSAPTSCRGYVCCDCMTDSINCSADSIHGSN